VKPPVRLGRFSREEFRTLITDGRSWTSSFDWPPGRAWLQYEGPSGPQGGQPEAGKVIRAPGRLTIAFGPAGNGRMSDPINLRITSRSTIPGWARLRTIAGFSRVSRETREFVKATLEELGAVLQGDDEEPFLVEHTCSEELDPHSIWTQLFDTIHLDPEDLR
jgi:hypothetical protein